LRHEVTADPKTKEYGRQRDRKRRRSHNNRVPKTSIESRRIPRFESSKQCHVVVATMARWLQGDGRGDWYECESEDQRGDHRRDDSRRQRLVHSPLDARHPEEREEHDDHDQRRKRDRLCYFGSR
jgi:hypothetical protein